MLCLLVAMIGASLLDAAVRPRKAHTRNRQAIVLDFLATTIAFGLFLAISGSALVAALLTLALAALLTIMSNAKYAMLGEPLVFSDLALIAALVRHPRFYFTATSAVQRFALIAGGLIAAFAFVLLFVARLTPHVVGLGLAIAGMIALVLFLRSRAGRALASEPNIHFDLIRYGLIASLVLYWMRWRETPDPTGIGPLEADTSDPAARIELVVIVQCESFADPIELTGKIEHALPGLSAARSSAWQWGHLEVSGFGAYTMRTEYGVLFGRSETDLGFRRYDPFLTAHGEISYALPKRLARRGFHGVFVHPHDLRFYGRDRLMPAIGFDRILGRDGFPPIPPGGERYIDDRTLGSTISKLIDELAEPTLIYAVTMENHGPWVKDRVTGLPEGLGAYLRHLRSSDTMLTGLIDRLSNAGRPALLVFFGDHRPSIPGVTEPLGARHTPYVMLRFASNGRIVAGENRRVDLAPDGLHHAILACVKGDGLASQER